ncbi:hypothetical protein EG68_09235 [Paragonimus skrjabini miyazakii]|uniref:Oxysterol-binding protein n=1 Tax=Paragonimus skrjabini miyazakii TaxID=59628 RepID=A0A8S9YMS5_9TREM|nr:hypothetical protein EG68_09235 [Paragonimus skrjabini miyazakii]
MRVFISTVCFNFSVSSHDSVSRLAENGVFPSPILNMDSESISLPELPGEGAQLDSPPEEQELGSVEDHKNDKIAKKPYNPIIGESFHCCWLLPPPSNSRPVDAKTVTNVSATTSETEQLIITYHAEQVSHHPPVTAFYFECPAHRMELTSSVHAKSKFQGMSPMRGNKLHRISAEVYAPQPNGGAVPERNTVPSNLVGRVTGEWNNVLEFEWLTKDGKKWSLDVNTLPINRKCVSPIEVQRPEESRRLWRQVTSALRSGDVQLATEKKRELEERQRSSEKYRTLHRIPFPVKYFEWNGTTWTFRRPPAADASDTS